MILREPKLTDSEAVYELVRDCKPLDLNSRYLYMLVATHFSRTSIVAEEDGELVGLISGYVPPDNLEVLFVWQVAVAARMRGKKLALKMLLSLLGRENLKGVSSMQTTVTPSNIASRKFFERCASRLGADLEIEPWFTRDLFGNDAHEDEELFRIGPITSLP
jgi:L-2,4-diaminobutyric acid acetyltransferase